MSKFIKLTNFLLNTNDIHKIVIQPNKYCFHIMTKKMEGFNRGFGLVYILMNLMYVKQNTQLITKLLLIGLIKIEI